MFSFWGGLIFPSLTEAGSGFQETLEVTVVTTFESRLGHVAKKNHPKTGTVKLHIFRHPEKSCVND